MIAALCAWAVLVGVERSQGREHANAFGRRHAVGKGRGTFFCRGRHIAMGLGRLHTCKGRGRGI